MKKGQVSELNQSDGAELTKGRGNGKSLSLPIGINDFDQNEE